MKLIVNNTGVFLDNQKVRHVTKIDLIELMPGSPKVVALQLEVDEVDTKPCICRPGTLPTSTSGTCAVPPSPWISWLPA